MSAQRAKHLSGHRSRLPGRTWRVGRRQLGLITQLAAKCLLRPLRPHRHLLNAAAGESGKLLNDGAVDKDAKAASTHGAMLQRPAIDHDLSPSCCGLERQPPAPGPKTRPYRNGAHLRFRM